MIISSKNNNRIIVALEGIDGAGKTTLINNIIREFDGKISIYRRTQKGKLLDGFLSSKFMVKHYMFQIPFYILLSYVNYIKFCFGKRHDMIVMDRCFLSNICYYFPSALDNQKKLKILCIPEIKMYPEVIFILDVSPDVGRTRDNNKKPLSWLQETRKNYLHAANCDALKNMRVQIIEQDITIEEKTSIVIKYLRKRMELWS